MKGKINKFVGSRIRDNRKKRGLTQKTLGEKLGIKHNTISSYENGTNEPELDILFRMADILDVSINDLFPYNETIELSGSHDYTYLPTAISAGLPLTVDAVLDAKQIELPNELMGRYAGHNDIIILNVNGDSMDKVMPDGSLIAIKPTDLETLKNDDIVVYSVDGEYSVKHYNKYGDTLVFKPNSTENHVEKEYSVNDKITIHGKVIMWTVTVD